MNNEVQTRVIQHLKDNTFATRVALGLVEGWQALNKFGEGTIDQTFKVIYSNMDTVDYPFLIDQNVNMTIVSDNVADVGQTIEVSYIEYDSGNDAWLRKRGSAVTNGLTPVTVQEVDSENVAIGNAEIMIPDRIRNLGTGVSLEGDLVGTLTLANGATVYGEILNGNNQSLNAFTAVPTDHWGIVTGVGRSVVGSSKAVEFHYKASAYGEPSQTKRTLGLAESSETEEFTVPFVFPEKTILTVESRIDQQTALASAFFDGFIVHKDYI